MQLVRQALELYLGWMPDRGTELLKQHLDIVMTLDAQDNEHAVDWVQRPELLDELAEHVLATRQQQQQKEQPGKERDDNDGKKNPTKEAVVEASSGVSGHRRSSVSHTGAVQDA